MPQWLASALPRLMFLPNGATRSGLEHMVEP